MHKNRNKKTMSASPSGAAQEAAGFRSGLRPCGPTRFRAPRVLGVLSDPCHRDASSVGRGHSPSLPAPRLRPCDRGSGTEALAQKNNRTMTMKPARRVRRAG